METGIGYRFSEGDLTAVDDAGGVDNPGKGKTRGEGQRGASRYLYLHPTIQPRPPDGEPVRIGIGMLGMDMVQNASGQIRLGLPHPHARKQALHLQ